VDLGSKNRKKKTIIFAQRRGRRELQDFLDVHHRAREKMRGVTTSNSSSVPNAPREGVAWKERGSSRRCASHEEKGGGGEKGARLSRKGRKIIATNTEEGLGTKKPFQSLLPRKKRPRANRFGFQKG